MKRLFAILTAVACLWTFLSCGKRYDYGADESVLEQISAACQNTAELPVYGGSFVLNMLFSEEDATLQFLQGQYSADLTGKMPAVTASMTQTVLGAPAAVKITYKDGVCVTAADGVEKEETLPPGAFFDRIPFTRPFVPETRFITGMNALTTAEGRGFQVFLKDPESLLFPLVGEDVYALAMIKNPRRELMKITGASVVYIFGENTPSLTSFKVSFVLRLYETPPYVPNKKSPEDDDYALDIKVTFYVLFT